MYGHSGALLREALMKPASRGHPEPGWRPVFSLSLHNSGIGDITNYIPIEHTRAVSYGPARELPPCRSFSHRNKISFSDDNGADIAENECFFQRS